MPRAASPTATTGRPAVPATPGAPVLVNAPPTGRARGLVSGAVAAWLLVQLALPASYYVRGEASEERFAWRMFSDVWWYHKTCRISLVERLDIPGEAGERSRRPVNLDREYHATWPRQIQRARRAVLEKVLRQRCDTDPAVASVVFTRACPQAPPGRLPALRVARDCRTGRVERTAPGAAP